jgi:RNA polymerase sigma-70 factor (ECF subfamily)
MMRDLSRMGYQPKTPDYDRAVKASMRIEQALSHLAPNLRSAVVLRDIEDLSCEEIAEILDISLGTVKSRILRGREAMRKQLAGRAARPRQKA